MRYKSLANVDYLLVDGRKRSKQLERVLIEYLGALSDHMPFHVVVLCTDVKNAMRIDDLGDRNGKDLFFHGEKVNTFEEEQTLIASSLLLVMPMASTGGELEAIAPSTNMVPVLVVGEKYSLFYGPGRDQDPLRTTPLGALSFVQAGLRNK